MRFVDLVPDALFVIVLIMSSVRPACHIQRDCACFTLKPERVDNYTVDVTLLAVWKV